MKAAKRICQLCNEDASIIAGAFAFCSEAHRERWQAWQKHRRIARRVLESEDLFDISATQLAAELGYQGDL